MAAVGCGILGPGLEAAVSLAGQAGELRLLLGKEVDDRAHRAAEVVEVEPVEAGHRLVRSAVIVLPQPADESVDLGVAPHPGREALEGAKLPLALRPVTDIAVDGRRVRPVRLDGDNAKAVPLDQPFRDCGTGAIEFGRAVAGLAEQDHARVGEAIEDVPEGRIVDVRQRLGRSADQLRQQLQLDIKHRASLLRRSAARSGLRRDSPA